MQRLLCCMANVTHSTLPGAMNRNLTNLVDALREIAYEAGCALLFPVDADATRRYAARYNCVYGQLCQCTPCLASAVKALPEDASAGTIRMAARAAAAYATDTTSTCCHRIAA